MYFLVCNDCLSYNVFFQELWIVPAKMYFPGSMYVFSQYNVIFQVPLIYIPGIIPGTMN